MKKLILAASTIIIGLSNAYAVDGKVTINGKVTDQTCTVDTNSKNIIVTLPTVSKSTLFAAGETAGRTPFAIKLTNCSIGQVTSYFEPGTTVDLSTGRLNNQASGTPATKVQVQLLTDNGTILPILGVPPTDPAQWKVISVAGSAVTLNYFAEYVATGAATAGDVTTSVQYTMIYQ
ncbi:fimbrial protein [Acinetobacter pullicarnis]|uniref:fimbrial protein n=1 Tax=Acinetobacter pullicarnis TaxID=2576829 RepID=UPI00111EBC1E|nr:fimbrial protein [Acinetobacter pullicarnis]